MWSSTPGSRLNVREWGEDDLAVGYQAVSGDTHLITSSAIEILELIAVSPSSVNHLALQLAGRFSTGDEAQIEEFITATLLQLQDLGLVTYNPV